MALAQGADLLILEAANPTKIPGHLTPAEAGRLAARAGVRRLLLTHFYPPSDEVDVVALAAREFSGEVLRAEDGLRIDLENQGSLPRSRSVAPSRDFA